MEKDRGVNDHGDSSGEKRTQEAVAQNPRLTDFLRFVRDMPDTTLIHPYGKGRLIAGAGSAPIETYLMELIAAEPAIYQDDSEGMLPKGALTSLDSMRCLQDRVRTKKFMLAIATAIERLKRDIKGPIRVVDAGCGAMPVMGTFAALLSSRVRAICIEINPASARTAARIVKALDLEEQVTVIQADATQYSPPENIDLLVSETMGAALASEPIVPIMFNLTPYMAHGGMILPEYVDLQAALVPENDFSNAAREVEISGHTYPYLTPPWAHVFRYKPGERLDRIHFRLPTDGLAKGQYIPTVISEVGLLDQHLGRFQSQITRSRSVKRFGRFPLIVEITDPGRQVVEIDYSAGGFLNSAAQVVAI